MRSEPIPIACTLEPAAVTDRLSDWAGILAHGRDRSRLDDGAVRVQLDDTVPLDELAKLVQAEQHCCAFFSFAITVDGRGVGLEVRAPEEADEILIALFDKA